MNIYRFYAQGAAGTPPTSLELTLPDDAIARERAQTMLSSDGEMLEVVVWSDNRFVVHLSASRPGAG